METREYAQVIRRSQELLSQTRNVGLSGDWEDLYTVVDFLAYGFGRVYPTMPCKAGCSHCCEEMLFRVSEVEWRAIAHHLSLLDPAEQARLKEKVRTTFAPFRPELEALAHFWSTTPMGTPGAPLEGLPTRCPFLGSDGRCGIYEVRPLVCRAYGHFGVTIEGTQTMLICRPFGPGFLEGLSGQGVEALTVPPIEPFYRRLRELGPSDLLAPLPLWALAWADASDHQDLQAVEGLE
jgi:Fe-S-cluster containining protein